MTQRLLMDEMDEMEARLRRVDEMWDPIVDEPVRGLSVTRLIAQVAAADECFSVEELEVAV